MIERYSRPQMSAIWSEEAQFQTWLDIEVLACEGWAKLGKIPANSLKAIKEKAKFHIAAVKERERVTRHDVAAFVSIVQENIGDDGRFVHMGLTSSDIVDTALFYRLKKSGELILQGFDPLLKITQERALKEKMVPMMGRTHGIHAEPITMGMKWLLWHDMLKRAKTRVEQGLQSVSVGKLSGTVGHYGQVPPEIEAHVCKSLGLQVDSVSTQVVARDRVAHYMTSLGLMASVVETIAVELRHLQRTEVSEAREGFSKGQKGSSAMPHKRNPISAENLTGLARLLRSYTIPAMEDCALWHERDISHSSVERVIGPDANILADYMLNRLFELLSGLETFPENMQKNIDQLRGVVFSQKVLLALIDKGMSRDDAYAIVQKCAHSALDGNTTFDQELSRNSDFTKTISKDELKALFNPKQFYQHLDYLYDKVLK